MKTRFPLLACCLLAFAVQAQESKVQMWKWTDANGVVHYSDVPEPGAVQVGVTVSQGQPGAAPAVPGPDTSYAPAAADQADYVSLTIVQPQNETSYFEADAVVNVQIESDPPLGDGDSIYVYLDGQRIGNIGNSSSYSLQNVDRGSHTLTAVIFDAQGKQKIRSQPVTFYMKQPTTNSPAAVGPNVPAKPGRPRPTPNTGG